MRTRIYFIGAIWLCLGLAVSPGATAAGYEILRIENIFSDPLKTPEIHSRAIIVTSSRQRFTKLPQNTRVALKDEFVYQTRVRINGNVYYRLVAGNYKNPSEAQTSLKRLKPVFANAWIYQRTSAERQKLAESLKTLSSNQAAAPESVAPLSPDEFLARARQAFLDEDYARAISFSDRAVLAGNVEQVRAALELAGTARERQGRFSQALVLYESLLDTDPPPEVAARITGRMEGIRTMNIEPKARLQAPDEKPIDKNWVYRGAVQQYYRDDILKRPDEDSEEVVQVLVTDVNMQVQRRRDEDALTIQIDAGLVADLLEDQMDTRVSRANISYTNDDFRIIGGRQHRSVKGVYGRFDGFTYSDLSRSGYQISYFLGTLAESSFDSLQTERPLVGVNLDFSPRDWLDVNLYLVHQEISGLTDRQAIGSEFQLQNDVGYIYGIIDYDVFYKDLNNVTLISNYRYDPQWTFNLTLGRVNSPTLSTVNALQGQPITSIDGLGDSFTRDEIYQLARDRTSKSISLYLGAIYSIDSSRQLNIDVSYFELDSIKASGGVAAFPSTSDMLISADYSVRDFFSINDYTSIGIRLSDSDTSEIQSFRFRSRIPGGGGLTYDPRFQLDFRSSVSSGLDQIIFKPSIKLRYRTSRKLNFEADFGIEYSDLDLPDFDQQIAYSLYLGYAYFF